MRRQPFAIVFFVLITSFLRAQNTVPFKSMLLLKNTPMKQFQVIVNGQKTVTNDAGILLIAMEQTKSYVTIALEHQTYAILYPLNGHLSIPKNPNEIPSVIIGTGDDQRIYKEFVSLNNKLETLSQSEVNRRKELGFEIDKLRQMLTERNFQICDLERSAQQQLYFTEGKERNFIEISTDFTTFVQKAKALIDLLKQLKPERYGLPSTSVNVHIKVYEYNLIQQKLENLRAAYERATEVYWQDATITADFRSLISYSLDTLNVSILQLKPVINTDLQQYLDRKKRDEKTEQKISQAIISITPAIEEMIANLEKRYKDFQEKIKIN